VARVPGVAITGEHTITRLDDARTRLDLAASSAGPLAFLADLVAGRRTRDYVAREAAGTKAAAEAGSDSPARLRMGIWQEPILPATTDPSFSGRRKSTAKAYMCSS